MPSVLFVCTGNICRSPMAEGFLRSVLARRVNLGSIHVASAGTHGWDRSSATEEARSAMRERSIDITTHRGRRVAPEMVEHSDLVIGLSAEHRDALARISPEAAAKTFALKELVRLLEALPPAEPGAAADVLRERVEAAHALRASGYKGNPHDEDVADPLGMGLDTYRAVAWEIEELCERVAVGLFGPEAAPHRGTEGNAPGEETSTEGVAATPVGRAQER